jgi:hypothetical protein
MTVYAGFLRLITAAGACGRRSPSWVQDGKPVKPDGVRVCFDDERAVSDAGAMLVATLAERLCIEALARDGVRLRRDLPGGANAGRKVMALLYAIVLGVDSIDDCDVLRTGRTVRLLGGWIAAVDAGERFCGRLRSACPPARLAAGPIC